MSSNACETEQQGHNIQIARSSTKQTKIARIVASCKADQDGQDAQDEGMVQPLNHHWCAHGGDETNAWRFKSASRCPACGSCQNCAKSGPFGKFCDKRHTQEPQPRDAIVRNQEKFFDPITVAKALHQGHQTAKANQRFNSNASRIESLTSDHLRLAAQ